MEISANACSSLYVALFQFRLQGTYNLVESSGEAKRTRLFDLIIPRIAFIFVPIHESIVIMPKNICFGRHHNFTVVMLKFDRVQILEHLERAIFQLTPTCR